MSIDLSQHEKRVFSQNGEDGVIEAIFKTIGTTDKHFVEFGVGEAARECNTRNLRERHGWRGVNWDFDYEGHAHFLFRETVTCENINDLCDRYDVPSPTFDLLSIDIDGQDFYVWQALERRPRVVVIEHNTLLGAVEDKVLPMNTAYRWDGSGYHGASIVALYKLGRHKGYSLVYTENSGVNLFFVRDDLAAPFEPKADPALYWKALTHHEPYPPHDGGRPWVTSGL